MPEFIPESMPILQWFLIVCGAVFSPGPNNVTSMNKAILGGYRGAFPFILGGATGFFLVMLLCALFNYALEGIIPSVKRYLAFFGALYMVWMALKPFLFKKKHKNINSDTLKKQDKELFAIGFFMQFINPKVILYGLSLMSTMVLPYVNSIYPLLFICVIWSTLSMTSMSSWALGGALFQKFFAKYELGVNIFMGALLLSCAVSILNI
ncbi:amino acid transporter LysE [Synergistales bacterium]|nr:amino acid transporter LysE [Synergistales bacterium]